MPKKNILPIPVWIKVMASARKKTGQQISFEHRLSRPHLVDVTNELKKLGWVTLDTTEDNKKNKIIKLTEQGQPIAKACRKIIKTLTKEK